MYCTSLPPPSRWSGWSRGGNASISPVPVLGMFLATIPVRSILKSWKPLTTILTVDDEPDALTSLRLFLSIEGFEVLTASSGREALSSIQSQAPDLVITDLAMPDMNGLELCARLRAQPATRRIPIILYTGFAQPDRKDGLGLYDRRLTKPTDLDELVDEVWALLTPRNKSAT